MCQHAFLQLNEERVRRSNQRLTRMAKQNDSRASAVAASSSAYARLGAAETSHSRVILMQLHVPSAARSIEGSKTLESMDHEKSLSDLLVAGPRRGERLPSSARAPSRVVFSIQ
jgi:hypothetical protein